MVNFRRFFLVLAALALPFVATGQASAQLLLRDAEIEQWLDEMCYPLMEAAGLNTDRIEILLIGDPAPNAFAGGSIMGVTTALITLADVPNEIEGVMAHEAGHLAGGHSIRGPEAYAKAARPALLSLVLGTALLVAGAPPEAGLGAIGLGQSVATSTYLAYSRGQESAADQAALTYLEEVGSSPEGLLDFFGKLANRQLIRSGKPIPYMQTHPLAVQRSAKLTPRAEASPFWAERDSPAEIEKLKLIQAKIHGFMNEPHVTMRIYPLSDTSKPALYARAVAYYRSSQLEEAERDIDRLLEFEPENAFYHELKGQMLFEHGKVQQAITPHRRSTELEPEFALLKINLARALVATEDDANVKEAIGVLNEAIRIENDSAFAWSILAQAYSYQENEPMAMLAQAEADYHIGDLAAANRFASRARQALTAGTPEHQRALDIIVATTQAARDRARR